MKLIVLWAGAVWVGQAQEIERRAGHTAVVAVVAAVAAVAAEAPSFRLESINETRKQSGMQLSKRW